jgi:hypothetical protein
VIQSNRRTWIFVLSENYEVTLGRELCDAVGIGPGSRLMGTVEGSRIVLTPVNADAHGDL